MQTDFQRQWLLQIREDKKHWERLAYFGKLAKAFLNFFFSIFFSKDVLACESECQHLPLFLAICTMKTEANKKKKYLAEFSKLLPPVALRAQEFELHLRCLLPAAGWFQARAPGDAHKNLFSVLDSICHSEMIGGNWPRVRPSGLLRKIP